MSALYKRKIVKIFSRAAVSRKRFYKALHTVDHFLKIHQAESGFWSRNERYTQGRGYKYKYSTVLSRWQFWIYQQALTTGCDLFFFSNTFYVYKNNKSNGRQRKCTLMYMRCKLGHWHHMPFGPKTTPQKVFRITPIHADCAH